MTSTDDTGDNLLRTAAEAHVAAMPRQHYLKTPGCPPLTTFAGKDLPELSAADAAHVASCGYCQKLLAFRFRQDCPGIADLVRFQAGATFFGKALEAHLADDQCRRCRIVLASSWMAALSAAWRTGRLALQKLQALAQETAIGSAVLVMQPEFASPAQGPAFRITAGDAAGLMLATLINERSEAVLYIEARGPEMGGRRAFVDVSGPQGRLTAVVPLEQIGKSATGIHRFGPTAGLIAAVGDQVTLFVGLEQG
jgi:hypothetical protein